MFAFPMKFLRFPMISALVAAGTLCVFADEVRLDDGSLIRGKIRGITGGVLTVAPDFAKEIFKIDMAKVENFSTDEAIFMTMKSGATFHGTVIPGFGNSISVTSLHGIAAAGTPEVSELWREGDPSPAERALKSKDRHWNFTIDAGFTGTSGTTDFAQLLFGFTAYNSGPSDMLRLEANFRYSETNGEKSQDNLHIIADYEDKFFSPIQWYARTDNGYDKIAQQNFFTTSALGLGYGLIDRENWSLNFRVGAGFRYESYEEDSGVEDVSTPTGDIELNHTFKARFGKIYNKFNYAPSLDDPHGNYVLTHESYFETAYFENKVGIRIGMSNTYNSIVATDNRHLDSTFYVKLVFKIK